MSDERPAEFQKRHMVELQEDVARRLHALADRVVQAKPFIRDETMTAHAYVDLVSSIEDEIRWGVANLGLSRLATAASSLVVAESFDRENS